MEDDTKKTDPPNPANPPAIDPPQYVTKADLAELEARLAKPTDSTKGKPEPVSDPKEDDPAHTDSSLKRAEERARQMVEEAAERIIKDREKNNPAPKKDDKPEPEKPPVTVRRLTKMLWGGEE